MKSLVFQGHKLTYLRNSHDPPLSKKDVTEVTGIKGATLTELENGTNKAPREVTVNALCDFFKKDPIYFYYAGYDLSELFPEEIPKDVREFMFDTSNLPYMQLAMKLKDPDIPVEHLENLLVQYLKSAKSLIGK